MGEGRSIGRAKVLRHIGRARVDRPRRTDVDKVHDGRPADVDRAPGDGPAVDGAEIDSPDAEHADIDRVDLDADRGEAAVERPDSKRPAEPAAPARGLVRVPPMRTNVMTGPQPPVPVFVDDSGHRRRRLRAVAFGVALLLVLTGLIVWLSQSGAPVRPDPAATCTHGSTTAVCRQP